VRSPTGGFVYDENAVHQNDLKFEISNLKLQLSAPRLKFPSATFIANGSFAAWAARGLE
jgi:hypothetical protein